MKTGKGMLIFVFLTGLILGATQPALVYGGSTGGGNPWDIFVYTKAFDGSKLEGQLSIYYEYLVDSCMGTSFMANMFYMVKFNKPLETTFWLFQGSSLTSHPAGICIADIIGQGEEITNFLGNIVFGNIVAIPPLFQFGAKDWKLTSFENTLFHDDDVSRAFVADIVVTVKELRR